MPAKERTNFLGHMVNQHHNQKGGKETPKRRNVLKLNYLKAFITFLKNATKGQQS